MNSFTFCTPTEIVFGKDAELEVGRLIDKHGGSRVFVVYGGGSAERSGLIATVGAQLDALGISRELFGGAMPNPTISYVYDGIKSAKAFGADFVLGIGGGSAIDAAKYIAHGTANPDVDIARIWKKEVPVEKSLPIGVILTIPAAGSETSASAVISDDRTRQKRGINTEFNRPRFALMNPALASTLPVYQAGCGVVDILMHTLDRYFSKVGGNETTDAMAEALLRVAIKNGRAVVKDPKDYDAMSEIMWCGSLSHNGLMGLGRPTDFTVHQLGHELGGSFNAAHGASLSTMWASWARYCMNADIPRFAKYARAVWGTDEEDDETAARIGVDSTEDYFREIGMPTCFSELGIGIQSKTVLNELSDSCVFYGKRLVGNFRPLNKEDVFAIYSASNR